MAEKDKKYYVYAWYIKENDEVFYIGKGSGNRYKTRKRENNYFMRVLNKYDCDVKILKSGLTEKEAFDLEIEMIAYYRTISKHMTNILNGGENPPNLKGIPKSEEWKRKARISQRKYSENHPESRLEKSNRLKNFLKTEEGKIAYEKGLEKRRSEKFRKEQSERSRRANNTEEYIQRQSEIVKNMWKSEEYRKAHSGRNNCRAQSINQYSIDGIFIKTFETIKEASEYTNTSASKISSVANGKRKTAGGFVWKYATDKRNKGCTSHKYNPLSDKNVKPIIQYDMSGKKIAEYISIADAARKNQGMDRTNIISNLKNKTKSAYGYVWKYKQADTVPSLE